MGENGGIQLVKMRGTGQGMMWTTLKTDLNCAVASRLAYAVAVVELAGRLVHEALALPWRYESPWCTLLAPAAEAAKDVDRAREALEAAYSWAVERQEWFYGKRQETVEDPARATEYPRPPAQRWAGAWRDGCLAFTGTTLKGVLESNGFEFDPIVRQWDERGWLATSRGRKTKLVRIGEGPVRCYVLNRATLHELTAP